ncbi:MAG: beta-propeller domain-containing protein [bacterium]|nr:beta-propeller domain-containing protein [bacterium]
MMDFLKSRISTKVGLLFLAVVFLASAALIFFSGQFKLSQIAFYLSKLPKIFSLPSISVSDGVKKFVSEQDFKDYLLKAADSQLSYGGMGGANNLDMKTLAQPGVPAGMGGEEAERVSETNVQVAGIDEPDIVKTDGKEIYFSQENYWRPWVVTAMPKTGISFDEQRKIMPEYQSKTKLIRAFPPAGLGLDSEIEKSGNLLLSGNVLVIFSGQEIIGYDISNSKKSEKKWTIELKDNVNLVGARLKDGKIYLVTSVGVSDVRPCPIEILKNQGVALSIRCIDIYHPITPVPVDSAFTAMIVNPSDGKIDKTISFVGSSGASTIYMSDNSLFATYTYYEDMSKFFLGFLQGKARQLFPSWVMDKVEKLTNYDLSQQTKITELQYILQKYQDSLDNDERLKLNNELANRFSDYLKENQRETEKTGIIKIGLDNFSVTATGGVPGHPLNQFSLDEYEGNLRIATTVGQGWWGWWGFNTAAAETANDVYVLNKNLDLLGSIKDLGLAERIYSARFVGDKGYLVTFRQTDPFYVLDLSNPRKPELKGELKIPGYSSYLHPISDNLILGIGSESGQVKVALFDVSDPANPKEAAKYILSESWSDALNTHHAFLLDQKHKIFFLPGGQGGYVFSYEGNGLEMKKAVSDISAKRAIYLNDYLYIIGDNKITVLNELDWQKVNELDL